MLIQQVCNDMEKTFYVATLARPSLHKSLQAQWYIHLTYHNKSLQYGCSNICVCVWTYPPLALFITDVPLNFWLLCVSCWGVSLQHIRAHLAHSITILIKEKLQLFSIRGSYPLLLRLSYSLEKWDRKCVRLDCLLQYQHPNQCLGL